MMTQYNKPDRKENVGTKIMAALIIAMIGAGLIGVTIGATYIRNNYVPCWVFSLKDAPLRCVK